MHHKRAEYIEMKNNEENLWDVFNTASSNSSTDMWHFDLCDVCNTVISNSSCTDMWHFNLWDVCNTVISNNSCTDMWHFDLCDVCNTVISNNSCTDIWHFDNKELLHLAAPRYGTNAETNFWVRVPTINQPTNHFHFMGIAVPAASCCHVISVMPLVLQTSPSDNLYWSKQLQIHYMTLRIGTWTVSGLFRPHTGELLKEKINNAWPGWAASPCLSAKQKTWVEKRKWK